MEGLAHASLLDASETDAFFERLFESLPDAGVLTANGRIIAANRAAREMLDAGADGDPKGRLLIEYVHPASQVTASRRLRVMGKVGRPAAPVSLDLQSDRGARVPVDVTATPMSLPIGTALYLTLRPRNPGVPSSLPLQDHQLLAENTRDLVFRYELLPEPRFAYVSPSATKLTGYTPEEHYADPFIEKRLVHPEDRSTIEAVKRGSIIEKDLTIRWIHKDGGLIFTEQHIAAIKDEAGTVVALEGTIRDVTERVEQERLVGRWNRLLRTQAGVAEALLRHDRDPQAALRDVLQMVGQSTGVDRICFCRKEVNHQTGEVRLNRQAEWVRDERDATLGEAATQHCNARCSVFAGLEAAGSEMISMCASEQPEAYRRMMDEQGVASLLLIPVTVKDQREGFIRLDSMRSERRWDLEEKEILAGIANMMGGMLHQAALTRERESFFNLAPDPFIIADRRGCLRRVNEAWHRVLGHRPEEVIGKQALRFVVPEDRPAAADVFTRLGRGESVANVILRHVGLGGVERLLSWSAGPSPTGEAFYAAARDVTEEHQSRQAILKQQAALTQSEMRLRALVRSTAHVVWRADTAGTLFDVSHDWQTSFASESLHTLSRRWPSFIHREDRRAFVALARRHGRTQEPFTSEVRIRERDGKFAWYRVRAVPVHTPDGKVAEWVGSWTNIEQERRAQAALEESEAKARKLAEVADRTTNSVIITDAYNRIEWVNDGFTRLSGYTLEEVVGRLPSKFLVSVDTDPTVLAYISEGIRTRKSRTAQILNHAKDGHTYWVTIDLQPLSHQDGSAAGFISVETDITAQRRAAEELRVSESRYRVVTELTGQVIFDVTLASGKVEWRGAIENVTGHPDAVFRSFSLHDWQEHIHPEDRDRVLSLLRTATYAGEAYEIVYRFRAASGAYRYIEERGDFIYDDAGVPDRMLGTIRDVTERRLAEQLERRLGSIVERSANEIFFLSTDLLRFEFVNSRALDNLGFTAEEMRGMGPADLIPAADVAEVIANIDRLRRGEIETVVMNLSHRRKDGSMYPVDIQLFYDAMGEPPVFVALGADVSARKEYEKGLIEAKEGAEEMARLKTAFLANMSHEIRTPLTSIIGFSEVLAEEFGGAGQELVQMILMSGRRLLETLNSVLDLAQLESRTLELRPEYLNLDDLAREAHDLFGSRAASKGVALRLDLPALPVPIETDRGAIWRILANLTSNAVKFTDEGEVVVSVGANATEAWMTVRDTGVGIADDFLPHLFAEFQQESSGLIRTHEGSGLGLTITQRLAEMLGGVITVESEKGAGSVFTVRIPRTCGGTIEKTKAAAVFLPEKRGRILVMERNADTRRLLVMSLRREFDLAVVTTLEEAAEALSNGLYDAALVDINPAEAEALETVRLLRTQAESARLPLVAFTTASFLEDQERLRAAGFDAVVAKPFTKAQIVEMLGRVTATGEGVVGP